MKRLLLAACLALAPFEAARATEAAPDEPVLRSPWLAAGLSAGGTAVLLPVLWPAAPMFASAGHFYAGAPRRGSQILVGGPIVGVAGLIAGAGVALALGRLSGPQGYPAVDLGLPIASYVGASALYGLWAAQDAYFLTERRNAALLSAP